MKTVSFIAKNLNDITSGTIDVHGNIICFGRTTDNTLAVVKLSDTLNKLYEYVYANMEYHANKLTTDELGNVYVVGFKLEGDRQTPWFSKLSPTLEVIKTEFFAAVTGQFNDVFVDEDDLICVGAMTHENKKSAGLISVADRDHCNPLLQAFNDEKFYLSFKLVTANKQDIIVIGTKSNDTGYDHQTLLRFDRKTMFFNVTDLLEDETLSMCRYNRIKFNNHGDLVTIGDVVRNEDGIRYPQITIFDVACSSEEKPLDVKHIGGQLFNVPVIKQLSDSVNNLDIATFLDVMFDEDGRYFFGGFARRLEIGQFGQTTNYEATLCVCKDAFTPEERAAVGIKNVMIKDVLVDMKQGMLVFGNGHADDDSVTEGYVGYYWNFFDLKSA